MSWLGWWSRTGALSIATLVFCTTSTAVATVVPQRADHRGTRVETMQVTLYGWNDNSPPGCAIAFTSLRACAGGTGTYANPITLASDPGEIAPGTRIYYPPLRRYFEMEDICGACDRDWGGVAGHFADHLRRIDLWAGGGPDDSVSPLLACEDRWTSNGQVPVIVDPPPGEPVDKGPIFRVRGERCSAG